MKNDLDVIYEDNHVIVLVKKPGILTQQDKTNDTNIMTEIKEYLKEKYNKPGDAYLGLVHRLDRMVGGLIVFAKTSKAASRLSENIRNRDFKKKYLAILNGKLTSNGVLEDYLVKNERLNLSRVTDSNTKNSKLAKLEYKVLKNFKYNSKDYTLVDINLLTGRHHQIRVQFANYGFSLYGDVKYGQKINKVGQNIALWSYYLSFFHPTKDEIMEFNYIPSTSKDGVDKIWDIMGEIKID